MIWNSSYNVRYLDLTINYSANRKLINSMVAHWRIAIFHSVSDTFLNFCFILNKTKNLFHLEFYKKIFLFHFLFELFHKLFKRNENAEPTLKCKKSLS